MLGLQLRPLTFRDRLAICLVALPLFTIYMNWARASGDCPGTKAKNVPCTTQGTAPCSLYKNMTECDGKIQTDIYVNNFESEPTTAKTMAVFAVVNGKAVQDKCVVKFKCHWNGDLCTPGAVVGDVIYRPIIETKNCP